MNSISIDLVPLLNNAATDHNMPTHYDTYSSISEQYVFTNDAC